MNTVDDQNLNFQRFLLLILPLLFFVTEVRAEALKALFIKGDVKLRPAGKRNYIKLKKGQKVTSGSTVKTGKESLALLKNKSMTTKVMQNSSIKISLSDFGKNKVSIKKGGALFRYLKGPRNSSKSGLSVKTKTASLGVRGTTFMVYSGQKNNSILSVKKGSVDFRGKSSQGDVNVGAGISTMTNQQNKNLKPRNFGLQKTINWNLKKDKPLSQPKEFFTATEKLWEEYKKEQEFIWNNYKKDQQQKWGNFINN